MIPYGRHHIDEEDIQAVVNVLRTGTLTQGPIIEQFEQKISRYVVARYAIELHKLHEFILAVYGNPPPAG